MIEDILLQHFEAYPKMWPQDAVKLIYQQEFGPEHMIVSEKKALEGLNQELEELGPCRPGEALYEPIGNGLCRLNLRPCLEREIPPEDICRLLMETARCTEGDKKRFWQGIKILQKLADEEETPFEAVDLDLFLAHYPPKAPALHHSPAYRMAYEPAYRIIQQKKLKDYLAGRRHGASTI